MASPTERQAQGFGDLVVVTSAQAVVVCWLSPEFRRMSLLYYLNNYITDRYMSSGVCRLKVDIINNVQHPDEKARDK